MNTACGFISIPTSLKSKSTLVIPISQRSCSPQNDVTSASFFMFIICGKDAKSVDDLNWSPLNCSDDAIPILIKSEGRKEKQPMFDKSKSKTTVCIPSGTPIIMKSPLSLVLTVNL